MAFGGGFNGPGVGGGGGGSTATVLRELIVNGSLGVAAAAIPQIAIGSDYIAVEIVLQGVISTRTAGHNDGIYASYNGDTTATNYNYASHWTGAAHGGASVANERNISDCPTKHGSNARVGTNYIWILPANAALGTEVPVGRSVSQFWSSSGRFEDTYISYWEGNARITTLDLTLWSGDNFEAGLTYTAWGIKA